MPGEIRWVCLLPDPVTGLDEPVRELGSQQPMIWVAPNREYAVRLIKADLLPNAFALSAVVSLVDWEARKRVPQRRKLSSEPTMQRGYRNPRQSCWKCGGPTPSPDSAYCDAHRGRGRTARKRNSAA